MKITHLALENFRLVKHASIELAGGANVFIGENAQGKTTLLEAVSYLSSGRSFRTSTDRDCIRHARGDEHPPEFAAADCEYRTDTGFHRIRGAIEKNAKSFWIDEKSLPRLGDLWGMLNTVVFIPSDTDLVRAGPAGRRALLGSLLARSSRTDLQTMQRYAAALRQRNALLKQHGNPGETHFEAYETQMAEHGARMLASRQRLMKNLRPIAQHYVQLLSREKDHFEILHETGCPHLNVMEEDAYEENPKAFGTLVESLQFQWARDRSRDRDRGRTEHGPHRGDMALILNGRDARSFSSQGQARTIVLAMKLAEVELLKKLSGEPSVLLLDDVMGELDQSRARTFINLVAKGGNQTLLTATDATVLEKELPINARFTVRSGVVERI